MIEVLNIFFSLTHNARHPHLDLPTIARGIILHNKNTVANVYGRDRGETLSYAILKAALYAHGKSPWYHDNHQPDCMTQALIYSNCGVRAKALDEVALDNSETWRDPGRSSIY